MGKYMNLSYQQQLIFDTIMHYLLTEHNERVFVFSGVAGSGKTTMIRELTQLLRDFGKSVATMTLTGKAAQVLTTKGVSATTIHSYMYKPVVDSKGNLLYFDKKDQDDFHEDYIFVDEASMVSEEIFMDLYKIGKKLVFFGDINQLPPITRNNFNIMDVSNVRLEEVHRQALDNPIIQLSQHILETGKLSRKFEGEHIQFIRKNSLQEHLKRNPHKHDITLCGTNKNRVNINKTVRKIHGRTEPFFPETGERVICLQNDYQSFYLPLYNGDTFDVKASEKQTDIVNGLDVGTLTIRRDNDATFNDVKAYEDTFHNGRFYREYGMVHLDFAYAITVHKSQGSEYNDVLFFDEDVSFFVDRAKFRYTAVTRSKNLLTIAV